MVPLYGAVQHFFCSYPPANLTTFLYYPLSVFLIVSDRFFLFITLSLIGSFQRILLSLYHIQVWHACFSVIYSRLYGTLELSSITGQLAWLSIFMLLYTGYETIS